MSPLQTTLKARPHQLVIWRACIVLAALLLAFGFSLALRPGSVVWWVATGVLVAVFLGCYLFYLPARLRGFSLTLGEDSLVVRSGVVNIATRTVPLGSVQFVRVKGSPLHKWLGICTIEVVSAGGRVSMPGVSPAEADGVVEAVFAVL